MPVPAENVAILKENLGIDPSSSPDVLLARISATVSTSSSPYTSAEMLEDYVQRGMPDVKDRVLDTIDEERRWRHAREEQEQNHRHAIEREEIALARARMDEEHRQQRRSQKNALVIALIGIIGALGGSYFLPAGVCIWVIVICVGGPSTATIAARLLDHRKS
ncbi:hypothetical protein [Gluconacetobacter asukensis]|uniref:Uncharacterized protein n=1 Tax=Gluconacetobacter asukensis TaxID=1017181 RepID=A0A7W4IZA9_9PROT|nr:hypothetical protein [Gluconacetobacter asukensis]MBB2171756.1 hypothetical protein [Gluconacetobacter asukensis]